MANNETTTNEIMEFLQEHMVTKADAENFATKEDLDRFATKEDLDRLGTKLKSEISDDMDEKLANLKGDLVILMRKEDRKVVTLIGLLKTKRLITDEEAQGILGMEPFPQIP